MDMNRYTEKTKEAISKAYAVAKEYGNTEVKQLHLLNGL